MIERSPGEFCLRADTAAREFGGQSPAPDPHRTLKGCLGMVSGAFLAIAFCVFFFASSDLGVASWSLIVLFFFGLWYVGRSLMDAVLPVPLVPAVVVGSDGVFLGKHGFISYARIQDVLHACEVQRGWSYGDSGDPTEDIWRVLLVLRGGSVLEVAKARLPRRSVTGDAPETEDVSGAEIARAIEEARAPWIFAQRRSEDDEAVVARGTQATSEWLRALRKLSTGKKGGYRAAADDTERLSRLLEDPRALPSARAAAAIALAGAGDDATRSRLRIAAGATANPRVRVAFERIMVENDDDAIAQALLALEEADREERGHRAR